MIIDTTDGQFLMDLIL